jgi:hypothetical protein
MSNPAELAVHELEALLERAKAAAEHIIHPAAEAVVPAPAPTVAPAEATAPAAPAVVAPVAHVTKVAPVAKVKTVTVGGQTYLADGLTQPWVDRSKK